MCIDVDKYHKLICQACDPVILLNVTNNTWQLVSFTEGVSELSSCKTQNIIFL